MNTREQIMQEITWAEDYLENGDYSLDEYCYLKDKLSDLWVDYHSLNHPTID